MATKKWTLISQTVTDHIKVPPTATNVNITRALNNANNDWASISKIVNKYDIKNGTHNSVIQRIRDIKSGKITKLSEITGSGGGSGSGSNSGGSGTDSSTDTSEDTTGTEDSTGSGDSGPLNSTVSKVPITDRNEALEFAKTEWNKIRRTSGHELECQVFGSHYWQVGEWCKVYLPTLNEYTDMYITKVDHSNDSGSEWLTNITLKDYAPSLSELEEDDVSDSEGTDGDGEVTDTEGADGDGSDQQSKWTEVAQKLQDNYEKPSGGWDDVIRSVLKAKKYDPDIKKVITPLTKKTGKSYVDVGHELCKIMDIDY